ncbi:hypothetical protein [Nocardioides sp. 616]|uniref:hypothetical protein n=1 Tax=Nocardioides sp. 616 TaxID=2268090 RepID=UPI0019661076|nr:hypothetical protein [Nocardioides sp. 616]
MGDKLHAKRSDIPTVVGDMATATVPGQFSLVYLVWNSIGSLRTQAEQVACFRNAARHLAPGGRFVIELSVPPLRRLPPGQEAVPFHVGRTHAGFDTLDLTTQQGTSHRYRDLMAQLAGMELERRVAEWNGRPFTDASESHVSVWRKPA